MTDPNIDKTTNTKLAARRAAERRALHRQANDACLWGLCANAKCRHAGECRGDPNDCTSRYLPLVPQEVRDSPPALAEGCERRLSAAALRDEYPLEIDAVCKWTDLVLASAQRPRGRRGA